MTKNADKKRERIQMFCMDDMVPQNHMLRLIDKAINWNFIMNLLKKSILTIMGVQYRYGHVD